MEAVVEGPTPAAQCPPSLGPRDMSSAFLAPKRTGSTHKQLVIRLLVRPAVVTRVVLADTSDASSFAAGFVFHVLLPFSSLVMISLNFLFVSSRFIDGS